MLLGEHSSGHEHSDTVPSATALKAARKATSVFAIAYITAQKPVHGAVAFHVRFYLAMASS